MNFAIKNAGFPTKKERGYKGSDILMTRELSKYDVWDTAAIDARQVELSQWIFDLWKFPKEVPPLHVVVAEDADGDVAVLDQLPEVPT